MAQTNENPTTRTDNRQILIDATLASIVEIGLIRTSVSEIISRAGLSRGMIHLHFQGKDNLIIAAAAQSYDRYFKRLKDHLQAAISTPQHRIEALILCDLSEDGLTEEAARITHEFQSATRAYPALASYSDTRDARYRAFFEDAFLQIATDCALSDATTTAHDMTTGLVAMMEGLWVDFLLHPDDFDRARAARVVFRMLSGLLPRHFGPHGALKTA